MSFLKKRKWSRNAGITRNERVLHLPTTLPLILRFTFLYVDVSSWGGGGAYELRHGRNA